MACHRFRTVSATLCALVALLGASVGVARAAEGFSPPSELVYTKQGSQRATAESAIAATNGVQIDPNWQMLGPFDGQGGQSLDAPLPFQKVDLAATYPGRSEIAAWRQVKYPDGQPANLRRYKETRDTVCYLFRALQADRRVRMQVALGFDDAMAIYLNGARVAIGREPTGMESDPMLVDLDLEAGRNELVLKAWNRDSNWAFRFQATLPARLLAKLERRLETDFPPSGEAAYYRIQSIPLPEGDLIEVGGLAFRADGSLYVATRRGDIWLVKNPLSDDPDQVHWSRFATGLHEILGLRLVGERDLYLTQRPEVTLVRDTDGDDVADQYETVTDSFGVSGDYHEFLYGPAQDRDKNLFISLNLGLGGQSFARAAYRGCVLRIDPDRKIEPWAFGLRSPNGITVDPDGRLWASDNQGEWVPACKLQEIRKGDFCGHRSSIRWWPGLTDESEPPIVPAAVLFPFGIVRSATEPVWDTTQGRFGPFAGQCFLGELTNSLIMRVMLEEVNGRQQGACVLFRKGFGCGVNRLCFAPDGSLVVGQTNRGWGSLGGKPQGLDRVIFTGRTPFELESIHVTTDGWDLRFTAPLDQATANVPKNYTIDSFTYHYWRTYGSPEIERKSNPVTAATVGDDGRSVHISVPDRTTGRVYKLRLDNLRSQEGSGVQHREVFYTLNALP